MTGQDVFLVEQLIRPIANLYKISAGGTPVAFCRQKKLVLKEDLRFFADESESQELFRIAARRVIDVGGRYDVLDAGGQRLGVLEHAFKQSLVRSTWRLLGPDEALIGTVQETSLPVAIVRRLVDLPIPYHFAIHVDGREVGRVTRQMAIRDRYELDLSGDTERRIDRRVGIALAVGLDAFQGR